MVRSNKSTRKTIRTISSIAIFGALAVILYMVPGLQFSIFPAVPFLKLHFDEIPALIAGLVYGPFTGGMIVVIKFLFKLIQDIGETGGVGAFADLIYGLALVLPAAFMYKKFHTFKGGILSIGVGILTSLVVSSFIGYYLIYPLYGFFFGAPIDYNAGLTLVYDAFFAKVGNYSGPYDIMICFHWILPFNLIKLCIVSVVTFIAYKPISRLRKFTDKKFGITAETSEEKSDKNNKIVDNKTN